jgi:hypothetical protein
MVSYSSIMAAGTDAVLDQQAWIDAAFEKHAAGGDIAC